MRVYLYDSCSTCKKAAAWLAKRGIAFEAVPIVDQPPSRAELKRMLSHVGGDLRKLFNTSGQVYREMGLGAKLPGMSEEEALALLSKHGKLVKRPFALTAKSGCVGFREDEWDRAFG